MNEDREKIKNYEEKHTREVVEAQDEVMLDLSDMKVAINTAMFAILPPTTTLRDLECFTVAILECVVDKWNAKRL